MFCGMFDRRKACSLISSRDHCQRFSSSQISDTPLAGFEPPQSLSSGFVEWSCAVVVTTAPRCHNTAPLHSNLQHEWQTRATQVRHERHKCDTSTTQLPQEQHKCDTSEKKFDFDNYASKNMFSYSYTYYMASERL